MIKEKRRKQRLLKKVLIGILVFMILSVIAVFVVVNVFVVKNVKVEGNELYDEQLITDTVLNDEYSWNSLYVLLKYTFIDIENVLTDKADKEQLYRTQEQHAEKNGGCACRESFPIKKLENEINHTENTAQRTDSETAECSESETDFCI